MSFCCRMCLPIIVLSAAAALTFTGVFASSNEPASVQDSTSAPKKQAAKKGYPYLLDVCPISGQKLGSMGDPVVKSYEGREVRFCCGACVGGFEADLAVSWKKVDEQIIKRQKRFYPAETCVVSGEALGSMGDPVDFVYMNRLVRFCCNGCTGPFKKDPKTFLAKLDKAVIAQQSKMYPVETCLVSGEALDSMGDPVEKIYGNRLVRFCCNGCVRGFEKKPTAYIAALDKAWHAKHGAADSDDHDAHDKDKGHGGHDHGDHDHGDG